MHFPFRNLTPTRFQASFSEALFIPFVCLILNLLSMYSSTDHGTMNGQCNHSCSSLPPFNAQERLNCILRFIGAPFQTFPKYVPLGAFSVDFHPSSRAPRSSTTCPSAAPPRQSATRRSTATCRSATTSGTRTGGAPSAARGTGATTTSR